MSAIESENETNSNKLEEYGEGDPLAIWHIMVCGYLSRWAT